MSRLRVRRISADVRSAVRRNGQLLTVRAAALRIQSAAVAVLIAPLFLAADALDGRVALPRSLYIMLLAMWVLTGIAHGMSLVGLLAARPPRRWLPLANIGDAADGLHAMLARLPGQIWRLAERGGREPALSPFLIGSALALAAWMPGLISDEVFLWSLLVSTAMSCLLLLGPSISALVRRAHRQVDLVLLVLLVASFEAAGAVLAALWRATGTESFFATVAQIDASLLVASVLVLYAPAGWRQTVRHTLTWFAVAPVSTLIGIGAALVGLLTMTRSGVAVGLAVAPVVPVTCALLASSSVVIRASAQGR